MSDETPKLAEGTLLTIEILNKNRPVSSDISERINDALFGNMTGYWEEKDRQAAQEHNFVVQSRDSNTIQFTDIKENK